MNLLFSLLRKRAGRQGAAASLLGRRSRHQGHKAASAGHWDTAGPLCLL